MNSKAFFLLLGLLLLNVVAEKHQTLQLDKPYQRQLTAQTFFTGKYTFQIPQSAVRQMKGDKWFFFVQVEPNEENEWVSTSIEISIGKKDSEESRNTRTCGNRKGGVDSCFFTNKQFDYKTQDIHAKIRCKGVCKIKVSGEISQPYKLQPGQSIQMDFQNTAYSKVFILDTTKTEKFDQLRITLRPKGFLNFPAPIGLYVNKGTLLPTRKQNDFESLTLWDNGEGVFIDAPDAQNLFTILVQSPEKNLLVLSTQTILFKKSVDIPETLPYFDYLGEGSSRLYRAKVNPSKGINIKLATFSGSIRLKEIYDNNNEAISDQFPQIYRSFSQMEYQIPAEFFNDNKNRYQIGEYIIFKIEAIKQSTYLVEAYQINKGIVHLVPELNRYVDLASRSSNQYYIDVVEPVRPEFKKSQIEVVVMHGQSKPLKTRFFKCKKDHGRECEVQRSLLKERSVNTDSFMQITATIQDHLDNGIVVYKFFLPNKVFEKVNNNSDVKHYIMTVVVQNQYNASQVYTIRYTDPGRNIYLKEQESHKDRISIDEVKHYVFTNRHADVQQVRVHLVEIAGRVHIEGFKSDPRKSNLQGQQIIDFHNTLKYTNVKLNDTLFVRITGKEAAFYSLQVQLIKESEREWWRHNKTQVNKTKGYNQVVIFEDIPYEFNLQPNQKAVYQIHTKKSEFVLEMTSLLPLELCMTQELTKPPFQPNCQENDKLIKKEVLQVRMERGKIANIGVTNNNTKSNKFSIKFSSFKQGQKPNIPVQDNKDNYTVAKCLPALLGKTTKYNIEKLTQTCYTYFIAKAQNLELMIDIVSREYDKVNILAALGQERITITSSQHIFKKEQVQKACKKLFPCTMKVFIQSQVKTQLRFSVQYLDGTIFLLDGIANTFSGSNNKRYFAYELYNKVNTTIILQNKNGFYKFYGNIVEASQYWKSKESQKDLFPTNTKNNLKSTNPFYYSYQIAIVSEKQIKEANCNQCLLLLTIQKDKDSINDAGYFTIQCTQQDSFLKPNSPVATFLGKNSFAFYEIYNQKEGTLVVSLNSQNQECARIYAKKGATRASGNENDGTTSQNTLIIKNAEKGNYAVTVEATEDCYYSIEYSNSQSKIYSTIEQGYLIDIRLEKSQSQKLLYHHTKKQSFRILTLHQAGQVSLNVRTYKDIKSFINDNSTKVRNVWSGKDFLRIENDSYKFCFDCYYLIQLVAQRQTKTSVIIPVEGSQFPIMMDSMIKQELKANQYETIRVFTQKIVQFEINVQYGRVNVSLQAKDKTQYLFTKVYTASQATQTENISTSQSNSSRPDRSYYFAQFSRIIIRAEENSGFSFGLISDIDESKRGSKVKYGIPEYLSLQKNKYECLYGRIDSAEQQFLISITGDQSQSLMNNLQVSCTSTYKDKKQLLELEKDVAKNQMIVKIDRAPKNLPTQYEFCMKSKENVFLTFIQSASLVYLPQSTTTVVQKSMNFSFYSQGKNVLQINECKSRAVTTILNSFSTTDKVNSEIKQIRKSNNIIEFLFYGPVYININTTSSTIAWRRKDQQKRLGYGYDEYSPNKLRYSLVDGTLKVVIYGLKKNGNIAKPMVDFGQSNYTAFLAEEQMNLYDAINCAKGTYLQQSYKSSQPQNQVTVNFDIKQILEKFKDRKYLLVGALVVATSKIEGDGKYRFLYPYQQIPMSALTGGKIQEKSVSPNPTPSEQKSDIKHEQPWEILLYIILGLLIIAGAVYIYRKYLRRFLRKRRLQKLSEQGTGEVKYQQYSSYTNQR